MSELTFLISRVLCESYFTCARGCLQNSEVIHVSAYANIAFEDCLWWWV